MDLTTIFHHKQGDKMRDNREEMSLSEKITYSTVLIRATYSNGSYSTGTGFIINLCKNKDTQTVVPLIITNWHVVAGSVHTQFEFCLMNDAGRPIDEKAYSIVYNSGAWMHHPDPTVDLCCLPLAIALTDLDSRNVKLFYIPLEPELIPNHKTIKSLSAMEEIAMVGYPIGLSDMHNHKPIIRRGITATHVKKDYQGKREFLVDMACFPGSSGSPIFVLNEGIYHEGNNACAGSRIMLVGVLYGGPQYSATGELVVMSIPNRPFTVTNIPTNLGVAIKAERILDFEDFFKDEALDQNTQDSN